MSLSYLVDTILADVHILWFFSSFHLTSTMFPEPEVYVIHWKWTNLEWHPNVIYSLHFEQFWISAVASSSCTKKLFGEDWELHLSVQSLTFWDSAFLLYLRLALNSLGSPCLGLELSNPCLCLLGAQTTYMCHQALLYTLFMEFVFVKCTLIPQEQGLLKKKDHNINKSSRMYEFKNLCEQLIMNKTWSWKKERQLSGLEMCWERL